jgi:hypothetical protein
MLSNALFQTSIQKLLANDCRDELPLATARPVVAFASSEPEVPKRFSKIPTPVVSHDHGFRRTVKCKLSRPRSKSSRPTTSGREVAVSSIMKFDTATSNPSAAGVQQRLDRCEYSRRPKALPTNVGRHTTRDHVGALQQTDKPRLSAQEVYGDPVELNITSALRHISSPAAKNSFSRTEVDHLWRLHFHGGLGAPS